MHEHQITTVQRAFINAELCEWARTGWNCRKAEKDFFVQISFFGTTRNCWFPFSLWFIPRKGKRKLGENASKMNYQIVAWRVRFLTTRNEISFSKWIFACIEMCLILLFMTRGNEHRFSLWIFQNMRFPKSNPDLHVRLPLALVSRLGALILLQRMHFLQRRA